MSGNYQLHINLFVATVCRFADWSTTLLPAASSSTSNIAYGPYKRKEITDTLGLEPRVVFLRRFGSAILHYGAGKNTRDDSRRPVSYSFVTHHSITCGHSTL